MSRKKVTPPKAPGGSDPRSMNNLKPTPVPREALEEVKKSPVPAIAVLLIVFAVIVIVAFLVFLVSWGFIPPF